MIGYEGTKIIRAYDPARKKVYRTALFRFGDIDPPIAMHLDEDDDAEQCFIVKSDSGLLVVEPARAIMKRQTNLDRSV